jgi:hypothetical protein
MDQARLRASVLRALTRTVQAHGWTYMYGPFADHPVRYGYTIGLSEAFGFPEAVVVGLSEDTAAYVFAELVTRLRAGERPPLNQHISLGLNLPVVLRALPASAQREHLWGANAYHDGRRAGYEAVQIVWPDAGGRFPWEAGYQRADNYQPLLFDDPPPE